MKALIIFRRLKDWRPNLLEKIIFGLQLNGIDVEIKPINKLDYKPVDILIQWYYSEPYCEIVKKYAEKQKLLSIQIEKGWFDRERHFLIYNRKGKRYPFSRELDYNQFNKPVPSIKEKYWVIIRQILGDYNLKFCTDYNRWLFQTKEFLNKYGNYPVYIRNHPGDLKLGKPENTLDYDLGRAIGIVTWNSSTMFKAMMHNIPVCGYDLEEAQAYYQPGLTTEWIKKVEAGQVSVNCDKLLKQIAGQQRSADDFSHIDYKEMYDINMHVSLRDQIIDCFGDGFLRKSSLSVPGWYENMIVLMGDRHYNTILEIGTFRGVSALFLSNYADKVITIDIPDPRFEDNEDHDPKILWKEFGVLDKIKFHKINNDIEKIKIIENSDFDFAYIDGSHNGAMLIDWLLVKKCGKVMFHDYGDKHINCYWSGKYCPVKPLVDSLPKKEIKIKGVNALWIR